MAIASNQSADVIVGRLAADARARLSPSWVTDCRVVQETDHPTARAILYLDVRFEIAAVDAFAPSFNWSPEANDRMRAALLVKEPSPKSVRVDRRLMGARASHARNTKPKRV